MKQRMILIAITIIAIATSLVACAAAGGYGNPPLPDDSQYSSYPPGYPDQGNQPYPQYPQYPTDQQGTYPSGPGTQQGQGNQTGQGAYVEHPTAGPSAGEAPQYTPAASTGKVAENIGQGQSLSKEQVTQLGGEPTSAAGADTGLRAYLVTGLEQWALYNGQWTKDYSAVSYYGRMNLLVYNDQNQYVWSYERYPDGRVDWRNWGYLWSGYYNRVFLGDAPGWHQVAVWGGQSGWSNVLWIYVWGP